MTRVLIVDDDPKLRDVLVRGLTEHGLSATAVGDAHDAARLLIGPGREPFDAVLLDVVLPGESGFELLADMRARAALQPVIFVSARSGVEDRIRGLKLGADDYLVKPFALDELLARLEAVLRRHVGNHVLQLGSLRLDLHARTATLSSARVDLSPREFDLLKRLVEAKGEWVSRAELLDSVWGIRFEPGTNVVEAAVARLRRRFTGRSEHPVETAIGRGYRCPLGGPTQ